MPRRRAQTWGWQRRRVSNFAKALPVALAQHREGQPIPPVADAHRMGVADLEAAVSPRAGSNALGEHWRTVVRLFGGLYHHEPDSRRSESTPGYPDETAIIGRTLYLIEMKPAGRKPTEEQAAWLDAGAGVERIVVGYLTPPDWEGFLRTVHELKAHDDAAAPR